MSSTTVVYLAWGPLGADRPRRFLESIARHPAGAEHELVVVYNGFAESKQLSEVKSVFDGVRHEAIEMPEPQIDLDAYHAVGTERAGEQLVFCGAYTELLADNWLSSLVGQFDDPSVGMVSAGGSLESLRSSLNWRARLTLGRRFPAFPNPHLRTGMFGFSEKAGRELNWPRVGEKIEAWALENGRDSFYRQVRQLGLRGLVVTADGNGHEEDSWASCGAFRSGDQSNLLAHDRRSEEYAAAGEAERRELRRLAWGNEV